ncbi:MAG: hypothetical protein ACP5H8_02120 [Candidatus Micrarchaeia archaeon]
MITSITSAAFSYVSTTVKVYPDTEGNAHVTERITIRFDDANSAQLYDTNMGITNDLTSWKKWTNIDNIRYHVNPNVVSISNLRITPLPKRSLSIINPSYEAVLQIDYDAKGLFNKTTIKARTYGYSIKKNSLIFSTNARGDIVLEESDNLYIILPENVYVKSVIPLSQNIDILTKNQKEFFWRGKTTLENFDFTYVYEESMRQEVETYFNSLIENLWEQVGSQEGRYFVVMLLVVFLSYLLLRWKVKTNERA